MFVLAGKREILRHFMPHGLSFSRFCGGFAEALRMNCGIITRWSDDKVDVPDPNNNNNLDTLSLYLSGYVVRCGSKNRHWKDMCWKEIGLCAQNTLKIQNSMANMIRETCMTSY